MTLRRISAFAAPGELGRQLNELERNIAREVDSVATLKQDRWAILDRSATPVSAVELRPGQAVGLDTAAGDRKVLLAAPLPEFAGRSAIIVKRVAANAIEVSAQGTTVTGVVAHSLTSAGRYEVFCDGVEYWI